MIGHNDCLMEEQVDAVINDVYGGVFASKRDGCDVVLARCAECKCSFEEEAQSARKIIRGGLDFLCLAHDENARVPAFTGITVQLGWFG